MRYYVTVLDDPGHPNYGVVLGVFRVEPPEPERYDRDTKEWVYFPEMIPGITGLGGESNYYPATKEDVDKAIAAWDLGVRAPDFLKGFLKMHPSAKFAPRKT